VFVSLNDISFILIPFRLRDDYLEAIEGMKKHLLRYTKPSKLAFVGALFSSHSRSIKNEMVRLE
jgi:mannosyl-oligosaccharide alpha-1,2-mannosidase